MVNASEIPSPPLQASTTAFKLPSFLLGKTAIASLPLLPVFVPHTDAGSRNEHLKCKGSLSLLSLKLLGDCRNKCSTVYKALHGRASVTLQDLKK